MESFKYCEIPFGYEFYSDNTSDKEVLYKSTQGFNLEEFYNNNCMIGIIMITPYQVIIAYTSGESHLRHESLINAIKNSIYDNKLHDSDHIIVVCSSTKNIDEINFFGYILEKTTEITPKMKKVFDFFDSQICKMNENRTEEIERDNKIGLCCDIKEQIPSELREEIVGIPIDEYLRFIKRENIKGDNQNEQYAQGDFDEERE